MYIIYIILLYYISYYFSQRMMMRLEKNENEKTERLRDRKTKRL